MCHRCVMMMCQGGKKLPLESRLDITHYNIAMHPLGNNGQVPAKLPELHRYPGLPLYKGVARVYFFTEALVEF